MALSRSTGFEPAQYTLNVEKNGFASYPDVFGDGPPERLTVGADHEGPPLSIALKRGAVLAGRILNASGEPEANLSVAALKRTERAGPIGFAQVGHAQTNDLGEFRIAALPSGEYLISQPLRVMVPSTRSRLVQRQRLSRRPSSPAHSIRTRPPR